MARSTYIYIVLTEEPDSEILGAYTVKHECIRFLERRASLQRVYVVRVRDGQYETAETYWTASKFLSEARS